MADKPYLMIIANSARMLAQAAKREGFKPLVIDCYGDLDTQGYAEDIIRIPDLSEANLIPAINGLKQQYSVAFGIYGAGFERQQTSLECYCNHIKVLGNRPEVFAILHDKPIFFALLDKLEITYPAVSLSVPEDGNGWLIKPKQGQGGVGIRRFLPGAVIDNDVYWQRNQQGVPHSVLFLADGKGCRIVGFNRQWTVATSNSDEFIFSGVINYTDLTLEQKSRIAFWLNQLVPELSLIGLNSLDFIKNGEDILILEINPRPSASMQLYDAELINEHIAACEGRLLDNNSVQTGVSAYQIVYARQNIHIPLDIVWPDDVNDAPENGSVINAGQPICSIIKQGDNPDKVLKELQISHDLIIQQLQRFQSHGL